MILVTGSTGTLGSEISRKLAEPGAKIALQYLSDEEGARSLATEIAKSGAEAFAMRADLGNRGEASRLVRESAERMGG
ncbi:MAG TPA: SDR family NAD(P)-dependent oxidoreductase, partial [bacterium]|nr:SDR family NAD(P)-dependent oxidoreductase [bacterium]